MKQRSEIQALLEVKLMFNSLTSCLRMSSGTFLEELQIAKAEECENMRGALLALKASLIVALAVWLKSISIPNLFISRITAFPKEVSPPEIYINVFKRVF